MDGVADDEDDEALHLPSMAKGNERHLLSGTKGKSHLRRAREKEGQESASGMTTTTTTTKPTKIVTT